MGGRAIFVIIAAAFLISVRTAFADPNFVSHWKFDEAAGTMVHDSAGDNDGFKYEAKWTGGLVGAALDFDGVDDYVTVPDDGNLNISGAITVSAWVNLDVNEGSQCVLGKIASGAGFSGGGYHLLFSDDDGFSDGTFRLVFKKSSGVAGSGIGNYGTNTNWDRVVSEKNNWQTGIWYHVAAAWDGTADFNSLRMYVNGIQDTNSVAGQDVIKTNDSDLQMGRSLYTSPLNQLNGKIDDVRIYSRALFSEEIEELYLKARRPVAHWNLDEPNGIVAHDSAGDNHGILYGANWVNGIIEGALDFDGVNDYVSVPNDANLNISSAITISAWINLNVNEGSQCIIGKIASGAGYFGGGYHLLFSDDTGLSDGTFRLVFKKADGTSNTGSGNYGTNTNWDRVVSEKNDWQEGKWYHVAAAWNGTKNPDGMQIYVDGFPDASHTAGQNSIKANDSALQMGRSLYTSPLHQFDGIIDDVRIYCRALSAEEVFEVFILKTPGDINSDGIVDYLDLEILLDQWLQPPGVPSADIAPPPNGDNIVNFLDFALLAQSWLVD